MPCPRRLAANIVVLGGANTDFLVRAAHLPRPGETVTGNEFDHAEAGGKGANQAVAASRLGARVSFLGRVGADERGRVLLRCLAGEGVNVRQVVKDGRAPTGVALISVDASGEKQIVVAPGANGRLTAADIRRPAVARAIAAADILILQFEVPMSANLAAARLAHRAGAPIVLDPAPALDDLPPALARQRAVLLRLVSFLRANEHEAESLTGILVTDRRTAQMAAERLLEKFGLRAVILAAGKGDLVVWRESDASRKQRPSADDFRSVWLPRLRVQAIDATGAGDAFIAALAVAVAEGQAIPVAAAFANAAAALATTKVGAQAALPKRSAVLALLRRSGARVAKRLSAGSRGF